MVSNSKIEEITKYISYINDLTHRLIIIAGLSGSGKTKLLQELSTKYQYPLINVNLQLSEKLVELTKNQRTLNAGQILCEIIEEVGGTLVLLDNTEILFDVGLKLNPLSLLKKISRNNTIVTSWNGSIDGRSLIYAKQGHHEYSGYDIEDLIVIGL